VTSRFRFISTHRAKFGVKRLCRILAVSRSGFYRWIASEPARLDQAAAEGRLAEQIAAVHADSGGVYGSPRVTVELRAQGTPVNHKRVERVMRQRGIVGRHLRRRRRTRHQRPRCRSLARDTPPRLPLHQDFLELAGRLGWHECVPGSRDRPSIGRPTPAVLG
jgi:transposase InsO family protein